MNNFTNKDILGYKNGNYSAFYVSEPFSESSLGVNATKDFLYYNLLRAWKGSDNTFPFNDSHDKTYNVRDNSDWESILKPRLRKRLNCSKNIIFFLSSVTKSSRALREEIDYGINTLGLPIIVIYPEYSDKQSLLTSTGNGLNNSIKALWDNLPIFRDSKSKVFVLHVPLDKNLIKSALTDPYLMINTKYNPND